MWWFCFLNHNCHKCIPAQATQTKYRLPGYLDLENSGSSATPTSQDAHMRYFGMVTQPVTTIYHMLYSFSFACSIAFSQKNALFMRKALFTHNLLLLGNTKNLV